MKIFTCILLLFFLFACQPKTVQEDHSVALETPSFEAISLLGDTLISPPPSEKLLQQYEQKEAAYQADSNNVDNIIWLGRFTAYKGNYQEAIEIYTRGIALHPNDARLFRHRGHRYITLRAYDEAIADFLKAEQLISDKENEIEPDGMPNAQNIPVSTLHGNIYYHLGLAHYLQNDMESALAAYQNCLKSGDNADNLVSSTHWIYMIMRRMNESGAENYLEPIDENLNVIENDAYHKLCLFYKGAITEETLMTNEGADSANDAIAYGLGNWYLYNGDTTQAVNIFKQMIQSDGWNSFGYIAAESDLARLKK